MVSSNFKPHFSLFTEAIISSGSLEAISTKRQHYGAHALNISLEYTLKPLSIFMFEYLI